ncbi:MAG: alpha-galactosidase [Pseudomonadota bacterium]
MIQCWRLDTPAQTLVLASHNSHLPEVVHWGAPLPEGEGLVALARALQPDVTGGMLDARPPMTVCPLPGDVFPGQPGADIGALKPRLRLEEVVEEAGLLELGFRDGDVTYTLTARTHAACDVIELSARMTGARIGWLAAPGLPAPVLADEMIGYAGKWIGEFTAQTIPWRVGAHVREVRDGRTSHEAFPGLVMPARGAGNGTGEVFALHLGTSGGHRMVAEELPDGRRQVLFGPMLSAEGSDDVTAGPLYITCSGNGLNGVMQAMQRFARTHILDFPDTDRPRPVHYNCWEAIYFDHDLAELRDIASLAAQLGAERFVLDDGWFKGRSSDTSSLGDWEVDWDKYPEGLQPLIDHVEACGMTFGLWVEPEMVNPDSDLARQHPDWVLGPADQPLGRHQFVLDMALEEVQAYLFARLDAILSTYPVDYLKWDHNRVLPFPDHRQVGAVYALIDRLREAHPHVEIESCASGGARIDYGILKRTHRVWLSDSNDALERMRMQHEAMLFLPPEIMGSHIGPRKCHTSDRTLSMSLRAWVAAQGHFGFEMDPRELTEGETEVLTRVCDWWKANRGWLHRGLAHRLDTRDRGQRASMTVSADGDRFVVWVGQKETPPHVLPHPVRLTGLAANDRYAVRLVSEDSPIPDWMTRGDMALKRGPVTLSGAALMSAGVSLPYMAPQSIWVLEGTRVA